MSDRADRDADWLTIREALDRILSAVEPLAPERVGLLNALGRTLAESIVSPIDQPPWDNSAMDGYAARAEDVAGATGEFPAFLELIEEVPAGGFPTRPVGRGQCTKIMTGAPIPEGANSVIRIEHTELESGPGGRTVHVQSDFDAGRNLRRRGEDLRVGDSVLEPGRALRPADIGVLASVGRSQVAVARRPQVAILSTGDELAGIDEFAEVLAGRKIVDSNTYSLAAAVLAAGGEPVVLGTARDDLRSLRNSLLGARRADVLITTAGASVGEHDLVKEALESLGFRMLFWRVKIQPGSPFSFGVLGDTAVFSLPGNPVSALVTFEVLVRPALRKLLGRRELFGATVRVRAAERISSKVGLVRFLRVRLEEDGEGGWLARLTGPQGSGILTSVSKADALLVIPIDLDDVEPGTPLVALPIGGPDRTQAELGFG